MAGKDQYSTDLGLSALPEINQSKNPEVYVELLRMRNAFKLLQGALDTYTGALSEDQQYWNQATPATTTRVQNIARVYLQAAEDIGLAQVVTLIASGTTSVVYKADATAAGKLVRAFCSTPNGVTAGSFGEFILYGINPFYSGLTPGSTYYLSTTPGLISVSPPSTLGNIVQKVGYAIDQNNLWTAPSLDYTIA